MQLEPQVTFRNVDPSDFILGQIHGQLETLERNFPGIISCRVVFERPLRRHGQGDHFRVDLVLALPEGIEIAVSRDAPDVGHEDPKAAVREAFEIAERRLDHLLGVRQEAGGRERPLIEEWRRS